MAKNQSSKASHLLHVQPTDARTPQNMESTPFKEVSAVGNWTRDPIQHIRDRTTKREKQLFSRSGSLANPSNNPNTILNSRKRGEPTPLHRNSRAPSELVHVTLDQANANTLRTPLQDQFNEVAQCTETPIDTPLATGLSFRFRRSDTSQHASLLSQPNGGSGIPEHEASLTNLKIYEAMKLKIQKNFVKELAAVRLGEMVAHAIIQYYQGRRGELIERLTHATYMAQEHDLKDLMGRAQLWKAIIFDEMGNTAHIASILSDVLPLVRDFGDDMDCYQLLKLLPIYAHEIFQYCMVQTGEKQTSGTASNFNSPASRGAFEAWYQCQITTLEGKCNHQGWPNPLLARDAAHVSEKLMKSNLASQNKSKARQQVSPSKTKDTSSSAANAALLEHMMHLEDTLKNEREEREIIEQEMFAEIKYYKNKVEELQINNSSSEHRRAAADALTRDPKLSTALPMPITPGQVTAVNELLKAVRPRSRQTPQSYEREEIALNLPLEESSYMPNATRIEQWRRAHREYSGSSASVQRKPWTTPTYVRSISDRTRSNSMASFVDSNMSFTAFDVPRPQPLKIRNPDSSSSTVGSSQNHRKMAQTRARSRLRRSLDGRRTDSRSIRRRTSQAAGSTDWRNPEGLSLAKPQPGPRLDTSGTPYINKNFNNTDQTRHDVPEVPSGPRLYPRRGSAPSSALVSPLTIDPRVELPLTDTPSPTKLKHTISAFRDHQEQRKRSISVSISPTSMSYETERRRSHAAAVLKARESREKDDQNLSTVVSEGSDLDTHTESAQLESQADAGQGRHIQLLLDVGTDASNDKTFNAKSKDAFSSNVGMPVSTSEDAASSALSSASSNKLSLGKRSIPVGHGTANIGLSSNPSKFAQDLQYVASTKNSDEVVSEVQQHTVTSPVDTLNSDPNPGQVAQSEILPATKVADVDAGLFNRMHNRQGSIPAIPSPLREAFRADDFEDAVKKLEKQQVSKIQAGDGQSQPKSPLPHHVSIGEQLVTTDKSRQLSIRDFAYDQSSETSDLYGVSQGSSAEATNSSLQPKSPDKELTISTNAIDGNASPVRMSKLFEEIENSYPSPIAFDNTSRSQSTADTWPSDGSVRMSAVPRLDLDRLLRQRQKDQEQDLEEEEEEEKDEEISPTTRPTVQPEMHTRPKKPDQDHQEVLRGLVLNMGSIADLNEKFQADVVASVHQEMEEEEEELSDEEIYGEFQNDKGVSRESTIDPTDKDSDQTQLFYEHDISNIPRTTMEDLPEDDADVADSSEQVEERGPDGSLEFLLPMTYVPLPQQREDRDDIEEETKSEREDMQKEIWSTGVI